MNAPRPKRASAVSKSKSRRALRSMVFENLERREVFTAGADPLILIPGFGGTFANESNTTVNQWLTNRGLPPTQLALEPFSGTYQNIVQSLKNVGYVDDAALPTQNLFVVNWDWRLPVAPVDANALTAPNGTLAGVTAASISNTTYETGLDYLGKALADVKVKYPTATKVDVIAHGLGGLIARSYVQSAAYGQSGLPRFDDVALVGVPNEGMTDPFNLSGDDWSNRSTARMTSLIVDRAYAALTSGTTINGPTGNILTSENLSPPAFTQRYFASLRHMLPTYDAVDTNNDGVFEKLSTTNPAGNTRVNDLLVDLNAGTKNAWLDLIGKTNVFYSTESTTKDQLVARTGPATAGFQTDEILSFQDFLGRRPTASEVWYEDKISGHGGDGTVATFSSIDPLLGDRRLGSKLILNPITGMAAQVTAVGHNELMINPFAQSRILTAVGASAFTTLQMDTTKVISRAGAVAKAISSGLLRPADALRDAANLFGNTLATTKSSGVFDSTIAYTASKLGTLLPIDALWQNRVIAPLNSLLTSNATASISQIVGALNTALLPLGPAFSVEADTANEKSIRFNLSAANFTNVAGSAPTASGTLNLGSGFTLSAGGTYTLTGNLTLSGVLGIDMTQGDDFGAALFVRGLNLVAGASGSINNLNANINIGNAKRWYREWKLLAQRERNRSTQSPCD